MSTADAVVVGAGPNGLVAANALADAGWDVVLVEANDEVGGAVRSAEVTAPGYVTDLFSAFYPLAAASPVIRDLHLEEHGLVWRRAPHVLAHALDDGSAALLCSRARGHRGRARGRGAGRRRRVAGAGAGLGPDPRPAARRAVHAVPARRRRGPACCAGSAPPTPSTSPAWPSRRLARLGQERFTGQGAGLLLTGNAMHSDVPPDAAGSGMFGWLLCMLGQDVGLPRAGGWRRRARRRRCAGGPRAGECGC